MRLIARVHRTSVVAGALAAAATAAAGRTRSGAHVGAQLAALRTPIGLGNLGLSAVGLFLGAWAGAAAAAVSGVGLLCRSLPLGRSRGSTPATAVTPASNTPLSLVTANVLIHNDRFDDLLADLLDRDADVVLLQEITPAHATALLDLRASRPDLHVLLEARDDYAGWATISRFPVRSQDRLDLADWPISWVVVDHPATPMRIVNVHVAAPQTADDQAVWEHQLDRLTEFTDGTVPTVLAGDFNATTDHRAFRDLLDAGFTDAFDEVGRGWGATWPDHAWSVPLLRLDHVLTDGGLEVARLEQIDLAGSDHRGLSAVLIPVVGPTPSAG